VDFSDASRLAMEQAAGLAALCDGALALIHVVSDPRQHGGTLPYRSERPSVRVPDVSRRLEELREAAERLTGKPVFSALRFGGAVDEILRFAREGRYDVLVLGTPGVLGCDRLVFGSVADAVVRRAPCNVLVTRRAAPAA
jgi:nucleotide-binding universal stress UspA family protein